MKPQHPKLRVLYLNSRSLLSRPGGIKKATILTQLIVQHKPHIIMCSETWLSPEKEPPTFKQYVVASRADRLDTGNGRGGGVIIFAHKKLKCIPILPKIQVRSSQVCGIKVGE